ncbi:SGNH/GDSL hydrolase family protein [Streptomyces spirodelae]|uniref:SGNH/GDSL hydrolase family protein n=1 Tax=Streptomyces spirodelae TaxID=2812904 RepID=A0ABS3X1G7_9ACTN|nr:SGNH/GDSL hydrolase family protein [Streptomyces spirodelae]MBO8189225.1 SGNH/GDSL hydrolase family protein [Streptomyces spirodelae]
MVQVNQRFVRRLGATLVAGGMAAAVLPGTSVADSSAAAPPLKYVALGDSVAAGIGAGAPDARSHNCWIDRAAGKRVPNSSRAYPRRLAAELGAELNFQAYCGATVSQVRTKQARALSKKTRLVTVQVGANDFGFADVLIKCAIGDDEPCNNSLRWIQKQYTDVLPGRLDGLYRKIKDKTSKTKTKVVVVGYPKLVNPENTLCVTDGLGASSLPVMNAAAHTLNDVLRIQAAKHGFAFAEAERPFLGHAICDDEEWINGFSNPLVHSFHPNSRGQAALADIVRPHVKP